MRLRPTTEWLLEVALTAGILTACLAVLAPRPQTHGEDFVQDYLSARAWASGDDPYQPLPSLRERARLPAGQQFEMRAECNPHPPVAILLAMPVAGLPFDQAYRVHCVTQVVLLAVAWVWLRGMLGCRSWAMLIGGPVALALWPPVWGGLDWGQPVGILALLSVYLWHLAETRRPALTGAVLALCCLIRPFFAGVAGAGGGWTTRAVLAAVLAGLVTAAATFAAAGLTPWEWYSRASRAGEFAYAGGSIAGLMHAPAAVGVAGFVGWVAFVAILAHRGLPAREALALGLTGGLLWYPLAWFHYDVVLLPVALWAGCEARCRGQSFALLAVAAYVALRFVPPYGSIPGSTTWFPVAGRMSLLIACAILALKTTATNRPVRLSGAVSPR